MYDQTYVLWRPRPDEVAAVPDACPHRGASLAMGSLVGTVKEGKCIKCPYHGLEFNAAGSCNKPNIFTDSLNVSHSNWSVLEGFSFLNSLLSAWFVLCLPCFALPASIRTSSVASLEKFSKVHAWFEEAAN